MSQQITIVGGGLAGLTAAIVCAEGEAKVRLLEAHETLGGRARSNEGPFKANLGPHALYQGGSLWRWLAERKLLPEHVGPPLAFGAARFRLDGAVRRTPPMGAILPVLRLRGREAPVELDFRSWAASHTDERTADLLSAAAGVYTFHHDPGELSAAFVWPQTVRLFLARPPGPVRYSVGGWGALVAMLEERVRELGVSVETGQRVDELPGGVVIVATEHEQAAQLLGLGERSLSWPSGRTVCIDLGLRSRRGDPWIVSDMEQAGWIGRYSTSDRQIAPAGHDLIQAQMPIRPKESAEQAQLRLEQLLDASLVDWRARETWRRRQVMDARSGALDMPGKTWRDRPAVNRGDGVFLAGDMVAAPGLLAEVSLTSAVEASRLALQAASATRPQLRRVA